MTRTYTRRVSTNAAPSRANWDIDQPRQCSRCGITVRITRDTAWFRRFPTPETVCGPCFTQRRCGVCGFVVNGRKTCSYCGAPA